MPTDASPQTSNPTALRPYLVTALDNIVEFGDTDIFPFPVENFVLRDSRTESLSLLEDIHRNFQERFSANPPVHHSTLAPVGYQGFRWATQLDPIWNAYLLALVISVGSLIERARLDTKFVFSYRFKPSDERKSLFDPDIGWKQFQLRSRELAEQTDFCLQCDISDFYPRIYHHRLENALARLGIRDDTPKRIMEILTHFARSASYSLPVGGPAARILSELLLNATDRLLAAEGVQFCRFADDYRIFAPSRAAAYKALVFLSEKLLVNEGLSLQKSKTKILSKAEFLHLTQTEVPGDDHRSTSQTARFMGLRLHFDPYSPTADRDFEELKVELAEFDIVAMLRDELAKSQVDISLTRRLLQAARHIDTHEIESMALSLIDSYDVLAPIYPQVLTFTKAVFERLSPAGRENVVAHIRKQIRDGSPATALDLNVAYMIRVLAEEASVESETLLIQLFGKSSSPIVRRDIIYILAAWKVTYWLSDLRNNFQTLGPPERRAFIVGSYVLGDEGSHWRTHTKRHFSPSEALMAIWYSSKIQDPKWRFSI